MPQNDETLSQCAMNAVTAAAISPFTVVMQNALTRKISSRMSEKPESYRTILNGMSARNQCFSGFQGFFVRQVAGSAIGYPYTSKVAGSLADYQLPSPMQLACASIFAGCIETMFTVKAEQCELKHMLGLKSKPDLSMLLKGATMRNSLGWAAGEGARKHCEKHDLSTQTSFLIGLNVGAVAGIISMPIQQSIIRASKDGGGIFANIEKTLRSGRAFAGAIPMAAIIASYTAATLLADSLTLHSSRGR